MNSQPLPGLDLAGLSPDTRAQLERPHRLVCTDFGVLHAPGCPSMTGAGPVVQREQALTAVAQHPLHGCVDSHLGVERHLLAALQSLARLLPTLEEAQTPQRLDSYRRVLTAHASAAPSLAPALDDLVRRLDRQESRFHSWHATKGLAALDLLASVSTRSDLLGHPGVNRSLGHRPRDWPLTAEDIGEQARTNDLLTDVLDVHMSRERLQERVIVVDPHQHFPTEVSANEPLAYVLESFRVGGPTGSLLALPGCLEPLVATEVDGYPVENHLDAGDSESVLETTSRLISDGDLTFDQCLEMARALCR